MTYQSSYSSLLGQAKSKTKRVFIAFAIEDDNLRDLLVGQSKNAKTPFEFVDMSVKEPWDSEWKKKVRTKIKGCDGVIGIITNNSKAATGQLFELKVAYEEKVPVMLIYGNSDRPKDLPEPIKGRMINVWSWDNIKKFIENL